MSKIKKMDNVIAKTSSADFTAGCHYQVYKVSVWKGLTMLRVYNDEGNSVSIEYPLDEDFGRFEKVD
ncbi:hypothetical protein [Gibbsiella quercinecans]|uniref:hypothetical protein n=1 Tax=Gibbsiella quercinecans TaxID=929813 RepID=UPI00242C5E4A|nr:hypothetical protein [Gibbsiella quercinecans]